MSRKRHRGRWCQEASFLMLCTMWSRGPRRLCLCRVGAHIDISVPIQTSRGPALRPRATTIFNALNRCCTPFNLVNTTVDATDSGAIRGRIEGAGLALGAHTPRHVRQHVGPQRAHRLARARPPRICNQHPCTCKGGYIPVHPIGPLLDLVLRYYWPLVSSLETTSINCYQ